MEPADANRTKGDPGSNVQGKLQTVPEGFTWPALQPRHVPVQETLLLGTRMGTTAGQRHVPLHSVCAVLNQNPAQTK